MKNILKLLLLGLGILMSLTLGSCSNDDNETTINELDSLVKFKEIVNNNHTIELFSVKGTLEQGYNEINLRIKNNTSNEYFKNAEISWTPIMHMTSMSHSCPFSSVNKITNEGTLYKGYIMFQMAQNDTEYWDLKIDYTIDEIDYSVTSVIDVPASEKRVVNTFMGTDGTKYLLALIEPSNPKVAINDIKIGVWKMQNMMTFPIVDGYTVKIDPRMPSMGNHSSPNNVNATQMNSNSFYDGKLSLTMTGYWKINLQLANTNGDILKGEEISDTVESSSIFFEIEF
ncbi:MULTISPECIES: hypothetical protein [Flavobacterium]|uniref:YtkA-like n=2 Tax=Flavobacterium TaxID=237 RepID=A0A1M6J4Y3_9FLAO|nr:MULTISPECIES: hypothetical protein [Flavobacterium]BCY28350.1 hypothetical protein KK2020170_12180 [Flavobacterium okayamense]SHJ41756.1 hypothetical protein SAMN05444337_1970 [Flavobacterium haoranii]